MADTPPTPANTARAAVDAEVLDETLCFFCLHPPKPASAYDRAARGLYVDPPSLESDGRLPPLQWLPGLGRTDPPQTKLDDDHGIKSTDQGSSELQTADPGSSTSLRTPTEPSAASTARSPSISKDAIPDSRHLRMDDPAPAPSLSGSSSVARDSAIGLNLRQAIWTTRGHVSPQLYRMVMEILDDEEDPKSGKPHYFFIDTGSDDTFGFSEEIQKIEARIGDVDLEKRVSWFHNGGRLEEDFPSHTVIPHAFDPTLTNRELRERGHTIGRKSYADGALAQLALELKTFVLYFEDCKRERLRPNPLTWQFGVAFAVNKKLFREHASGVLGLGPSGQVIQHAYRDYSSQAVTPPSFLAVLQDKLKPTPAPRPGEDIAIFFCLRLAPECYKGGRPGRYPMQSWLSFNVWPCRRQPAWNDRKIVVCNSDPHRRRWTVYLRAVRFARVNAGTERPLPFEDLHGSYLPDTALVFVGSSRPRGLVVHLDTGTSVTYLPLDAVQRMNKNLFMNEGPIAVPQDGVPALETYMVDPDCWMFRTESKVQVVYEFEGEGSEPVFVSGPLETFAYQRNQWPLYLKDLPEGLVFPNGPSDTRTGTLGLNFFQSMYVSLHKSTDGLDFVRLAGQWPERFAADLEDYFVACASAR